MFVILSPCFQVEHTASLDAPCSVVSARQHTQDGNPVIEAVFLTVQPKSNEEESEGKGSTFITSLHWLTFQLKEGAEGWKVVRTRRLESRSSPDYVALEPHGGSIHIASEKTFRFIYDSEKPVEDPEAERPDIELKKYTWSQTQDDITLQFTIPEGVRKADIDFQLSHRKLRVGIKNGVTLLTGELYSGVDPDGCTWTLDVESRRLSVELCKREPDLWPNAVVGDTDGEMTMDPEQVCSKRFLLCNYNNNMQVFKVPVSRVAH